MPSRTGNKRPIHIANASGAINDGMDQLYRLASEGAVDAITADYLAEFNIAWLAIEMMDNPDGGFERGFLEQLDYKNAAELIAEKGIKVVHNGGALNPQGLARETEKLLKSKGITNLVVAWVTGDDLTAALPSLTEAGDATLDHLDIKGSKLTDKLEKSQVIAANAYIGMKGIIAALEAGADIVICGRCTDDSPAMALASWWHGWSDTQYDQHARSLMAGHLTECGPYVCGGNFSGFQSIPNLYRVGFPIAEIAEDGTTVISKHQGTNGAITADTVKAQLLYEIQGSHYLNPDVIAKIDETEVVQLGPDRVQITGITGLPPPSTTKLAVSLQGGYQAEICSFAVGPDIEAKIAMQRDQVLRELDPAEFTCISIEPYGTAKLNPDTQAEATVMIRHFVQSPKLEAIESFKKALFMSGLQGYPGLFFHQDWRTLAPKRFLTYYPAKFPQSALKVQAHLRGRPSISVDPPSKFTDFHERDSYDPVDPVDLASFGETCKRPIGDIVYMRSGDKGGNANVGIWVRDESQWPWLRSFLTIERFRSLLGKEDKGYRIERFEAPNIHAVHFVTYGILQEGVSSSSLLDGFGKSHGEFLRARVVDIPVKFFS